MRDSTQKFLAGILAGFKQSTQRGDGRGAGGIADPARLDAIMHRVDRDRHVIGAEQRLQRQHDLLRQPLLYLRPLGKKTAQCD